MITKTSDDNRCTLATPPATRFNHNLTINCQKSNRNVGWQHGGVIRCWQITAARILQITRHRNETDKHQQLASTRTAQTPCQIW